MEIYLQASAGVLLAVILSIVVGKRNGELSLILVIAVCSMVLLLACFYLRPVIDFIQTIQSVGRLDADLVEILLKVAGISLISQIASLICADGGSSSMGKALQMMATAMILYLSIPIFRLLLELLEKILGNL